jgi:hypothetical protein
MRVYVATGVQGGSAGLVYIELYFLYVLLYPCYNSTMSTISASLSNKKLIASIVLHLGKEGHDAEAFWASFLDTQKQAVQFSMNDLTSTGHEEVLQSLKEWRLDATLSAIVCRCLTVTLMFYIEPISSKALTTWMEFQDNLDVCGQLDGETYVRAYFRLCDMLPNVFLANPLSLTAAMAHLDAIHDVIFCCEYPLNFSAFPWL